MSATIRILLASSALAILAGCASQPTSNAAAGKHLVYRDASGAIVRQFDYPDNDFCKRVERAAGNTARCHAESASTTMTASATLRYNPPGVLVHAHYPDMARCRAETGQLGAGVELINACAGK
jgi:hypothetical protein